MENLINLNCGLNSSLNKNIWYKIYSIKKCGDDYLIEYRLFTRNINGKEIYENFTRESLLSYFAKKEQTLLRKMIEMKCGIKKVITTDVVII